MAGLRKDHLWLLLPASIVLVGAFLLHGYLPSDLQVILGCLVAPFAFRLREKGRYSIRYWPAVLLFSGLHAWSGMKVFLFLALGCLLIFSLESTQGRVGLLPFLFLITLTPALGFVVHSLTFTLRLALSHYAAELLHLGGIKVVCKGNYFQMADGLIFNVDKACLGLNMFNTGLVVTSLLIAVAEKALIRSASFIQLGLIFLVAAALLVVANLFRIVLIVLSRAMPETWMHDMIGMLALVVYLVIPLWFFVRWIVKRASPLPVQEEVEKPPHTAKSLFLTAMGLSVILLAFTHVKSLKALNPVKDPKMESIRLAGFTRKRAEDGIVEFRKPGVLVYLKPAGGFLISDHPPVLCWKGSGFQVEEVSEKMWDGHRILFAVLKKDNKKQYTAWWYDNGIQKTINPWECRTAGKEPFRVVNITTPSPQHLCLETRKFLKMKLF